MNNNKHAFFAAVCTLFIVACSPNITTEEYINNAKQSILNDKHTEAIIVLKKAIRKDPDNEELRLLLGNAYLNDGKSAEAEKELSLALNRLQANPSEVLPSLFKALHLQDKNIDIIKLSEQYSDTELPQTILPEILMYRVYAHLRNGEREEAKRLVTLANEISTEGIYTNYSNALLQSNDSEVDNSLQLLEQVLAQKPDFAEAILLKGQLLLTNRDYAKAILAFKEYAALNPNDIKIHLFLANTYIKNNQYNEADDSLKILLPLVPYQPLLNHLKAVSSFKFKNYTAALEHAKVSIQNGLVTTPNRVIAGLSAFNLGHYEQAHQYLNPLRNELPKSHPVNKILVAVKMQLGYVEELESSIDNIEGLSEEDVNLLTSASFEMLKKGNVEGAKAAINKTDGIVGLNSADLTSIGILKLSMDDIDGITSLESALEGNPDLSVAKIALAAAYIQNNEFEKAHILASDWKLNNPDVVDGFNLAAKIYFTQGNKEAAEIELNKALEINKVNPFSILYFANESYLKGDYQEAVNHIDLMLPS